jgi:hypothetical protein
MSRQNMSSLILVSEAEARVLRVPERLRAARAETIGLGPFSVTFARPDGGTPAGKHDYFSEGPYWWPNPAYPDGPYIRRDGVVNPDRFTRHHNDLGRLGECILTLALSAFLLKDEEAAQRAWHLAAVWFVNPDTRMNPDLEFGQAIRGRTTGRGIGLIDTRPFIWVVQGLSLLRAAYPDARIDAEVVDWFRQFTQWMRWSGKGRDELYNGNNHSTWWVAQVAAYSLYADIPAGAAQCWALFRDYLVPNQFRPDGSQPHEEARTRSLSYSAMNLDGFAIICRMAKRAGVDLWRFETPEGAGVLRTVEYLTPFLEDPSRWTKPQITPVRDGRGYATGLAGLDVDGRATWAALQRRWGAPPNAWGLLLSALL